jgi:hypothetical protein
MPNLLPPPPDPAPPAVVIAAAFAEGKCGDEHCMRQYRHYKGGVYDLICEARLESAPEVSMIVYRAADGSVWTRPRDVFSEIVEIERTKVELPLKFRLPKVT